MPCSYSSHSLVELPWNGLIFLKANEPAAKRGELTHDPYNTIRT